MALDKGALHVASLLLSRGANVNAVVSDEGNTLLHEALLASKFDLARQLVVHGADLEAKNKRGIKPLKLLPASHAKTKDQLTGNGCVCEHARVCSACCHSLACFV